ncbi:MAG: ABC transporter substrate-binding protein [Zestosphaera sp.]
MTNWKAVSKTVAVVLVLVVAVALIATYLALSPPYVTPTTPATTPTSPTTLTTPATTTPQLKRTLIIAIPEEPMGLDVQQVTWSNEVHDMIFQPLVVLDENMNIVPDLALSWEVTGEGTVLMFHIPSNAKFSNGDPVTAEAVKRSIERYKDISPYAEDFADVAEMIAIDEYTLKIILKQPAPYLWSVLVTNYGAPVNAEVAERVGPDVFNREPVGSGPYAVKEWVRGSHVVLTRNNNYKTNLPFVVNKGPNPYVDEVIIRFIPEDLTRITELEAGRVDVVRGVPLEEVKRLRGNPNIQLYETLAPGIHYIMVNLQKTPLNDVRVRKAIMLALNRDEIAQILDNNVVPWHSFLSPSQICYNETVETVAKTTYAHNIEAAKELLREAGWVDTNGDGVVDKDGTPLTLTLLSPVDDPPLKKAAPLIQAQLAKVGIQVSIKEYTYDYIRELTNEWNFELALRRFSWADPDILIYLVHSVYGNYTYSNPEVDALLELGRSVTDMIERSEVYSEAQEILLKDLPLIPLFVLKDYTAVNKNVKGLLVLPPYGTIFINDVWIEQK